MSSKNTIKKKNIAPGGEDKIFMMESLIFTLLIAVFTGVMVYVFFRLVMMVSKSVTVNMSP